MLRHRYVDQIGYGSLHTLILTIFLITEVVCGVSIALPVPRYRNQIGVTMVTKTKGIEENRTSIYIDLFHVVILSALVDVSYM